MLSVILRCPPLPGKKVGYPGFWEENTATERFKNGIPILESLYDKIKMISNKYGLVPPKIF